MARGQRVSRFHRQHGAVQPSDRRELEAAGWRTMLDYHENHVRGRDGRLTHLQVVWQAAAEHDPPGGGEAPMVVTATAPTVEKVWLRLRMQADVAAVSLRRGQARPSAAAR